MFHFPVVSLTLNHRLPAVIPIGMRALEFRRTRNAAGTRQSNLSGWNKSGRIHRLVAQHYAKPIRTVQQPRGHSDVRATMIYTHLLNQ
jgi:site-specific recombinase XerC